MYVYDPPGPTCYLGNILDEYDHLPAQPNAPDAMIVIDLGERQNFFSLKKNKKQAIEHFHPLFFFSK